MRSGGERGGLSDTWHSCLFSSAERVGSTSQEEGQRVYPIRHNTCVQGRKEGRKEEVYK